MLPLKGKTVHIEATAYLHDTRLNRGYVWGVRVFDPRREEKTLFQRVYDDQVFTSNGQHIAPTFMDELDLPLPSGSYGLSVGAYEVKPEEGLAGLRLDLAHRGPYGSKKLTLGR